MEYWETKIQKNKERDAKVIDELENKGWIVIVIWECDIKTKERREVTLSALSKQLSRIKDKSYLHPYYPTGEESDSDIPLAAEPQL